MEREARAEHVQTDPGLKRSLRGPEAPQPAASAGGTAELLAWIGLVPAGAHMRSLEDAAFPLTSRNLGTAELDGGTLSLGYMSFFLYIQ